MTWAQVSHDAIPWVGIALIFAAMNWNGGRK